MIESSVNLNYSQRLKAATEVALGSPSVLFWLIVSFLCGIFLLVTSKGPLDIGLGILCIGCFPAIFAYQNHRSHMAALKNGPYLYRFTPDGFELATKTAEIRQSWKGIPRVRKTSDFLLVYPSKQCAYPLPLGQISHSKTLEVLEWARTGGTARVDA